MFDFGSLISAGTKLIGGLMDQNEAENNREAAYHAAQKQYENQKEFAQQGIRWKVADARAAGLHPLAALGANTLSYSPVTISGGGGSSLGAAVSSMGGDIGRAINSTRTAPERLEAAALTKLQLEGLQLDNDIKRATVASAHQRMAQAANPPIPVDGPFAVPEEKKADERNPLMMLDSRVKTDPGTSPGKAWEDVLGDDIFSPGFLPNLIGMLKANTQGMSFWDILKAIDRKTAIWGRR